MSLARNLRSNPTPAELALWHALSSFRPRFTRQLTIDSFIADLACRRARLIVEVDGSQHADNPADMRRTTLLEAKGWRVLRFWNNEVELNIDGVIDTITSAVAARLPDGETPTFINSRAGRARSPRTRKEEPPLTPPRSRGGELASSPPPPSLAEDGTSFSPPRLRGGAGGGSSSVSPPSPPPTHGEA